MKSLILAILFLSTIACTTNTAQGPQQASNTPSSSPPGPIRTAPVELGADSKMRALWDATFTDCGNGIFATRNRNGFYKQIKDHSFRLEPQQLTEADSLNNITWKGTVSVKWAAERNSSSGDWQSPMGGGAFMYFEKRNGKWSEPNIWEYQKAPCQ